jgi:hypothetical protein
VIASIQDELTYQNFPKEYKLIVARIVVSRIKYASSSPVDLNIKRDLYQYLSKHE